MLGAPSRARGTAGQAGSESRSVRPIRPENPVASVPSPELLTSWSPLRRPAKVLTYWSRPIAAELARADAIVRGHVSGLFERELAALRTSRRATTLEALDALTSWEAWERLRTAQRLDAAAAGRVVTATVLGVLDRGPAPR